MANRIKKGDKVAVLNGKDKGKRGEVLRVLLKESRVLVQGVNVIKRHTRATQANPGGIITREAPVHISNISLIDPQSDAPTKVGFRFLKDGTKVRYAKKSGEQL